MKIHLPVDMDITYSRVISGVFRLPGPQYCIVTLLRVIVPGRFFLSGISGSLTVMQSLRE
jgi:hypothetical protein